VLGDILDHASSSSDDFGHVVRGDHHVKRIAREFLVDGLIVIIDALAQLLDPLLNIFESALHGADALIRLQNPIVVIFVTSHVDAQSGFQILREVPVPANDEATSLSVNDKLGS